MQIQSSDPSLQTKAGASPTIDLLRCGACEQLTYPASAYGCNFCGTPREAGSTFPVAARGVLRNWVTVYADFNPGLRAPYIVGEIDIAPGVVEQVLIDVANESELCEGQILVGVEQSAEKDANGQPAKQYLRFVPEENEGGSK